MKQIRCNVFETNSSSTHSLAINHSKLNNEINEELFKKAYVINARDTGILNNKNGIEWKGRELDGYVFTSIKDKLTYLAGVLLATPYDRLDPDTPAGKLYALMKKCFPNTKFELLDDPEESDYLYEDGDCWFSSSWDDGLPYISLFLDENKFKHLMQDGKIYFGNRDDWDGEDTDSGFQSYIYEVVMNKENNLFCETSG